MLVVEGMGFTTVILYGINLLFNPVVMVYEEDINNPGKPITRRPYHVRVCVPCYKESLEILRRTVMALYDAELPEVSLLCKNAQLLALFCTCLARLQLLPSVLVSSSRLHPELLSSPLCVTCD